MKLRAAAFVAFAALISVSLARDLQEHERPSRLVEAVARHLHQRGLKIFGGGPAAANRYSYYVSIRDFDTRRDGWQYYDSNFPMQLNSATPRHLCGGVMVQPLAAPYASSYQFVLTSASCIQNNPNPMVIVGANKENYNINGGNNPPQWPELNSLSSWPNARTTYASYIYPGTMLGGDNDFAVLVLDQQTKAAPDGNCTTCIKMTASKPAVGTKYTAVGLGSAGGMTDGNPQPNLKEALLTVYDVNKCIADRNAPTTSNPFVKKFWKQRFGNPKFTIQSSFCTTTDKASAAGLCNLDSGSPLVSKGASVAEDKLVGVGAAVTASCNSYYDPQVWVDVTTVASWVQGIMKVVTPKLNATKFQVPSNDPQPVPAVQGLKPIYSYSMRIALANPGANPGVSKTTAVPCGAGDSDISFAEVGTTMAATISARILRKKYFPDKPGQFSPCGVLPVSCKANTVAGETVIKFEWSSGKDPVAMNAWFKAGPGSVLAGDDIGFFSPVNDPDYASGLRYWALKWRTDANVYGAIAVTSVEVTTGRGDPPNGYKKPVWPSLTTPGPQKVNITGWPQQDATVDIGYDGLTWVGATKRM